jgi:hypothetical protein
MTKIKTRKRFRFHVDCFDCDKHYCLGNQADQCLIQAVHNQDNHSTCSGLGVTECDDSCNKLSTPVDK